MSMSEFISSGKHRLVGSLKFFDEHEEKLQEGDFLIVKYGNTWAHIGKVDADGMIDHKLGDIIYKSNIAGIRELYPNYPIEFYTLQRSREIE